MNKISICGPHNCSNSSNHHDNCEDFIAERLKVIDKSVIIDLYKRLCSEFKVEKINSFTLIDGEYAQDALFDRIILELFGCNSLKSIISELKILNGDIDTNKSLVNLLKEQKIKIETILYGYKDNFRILLQIAREFSIEYGSDIFINVLVRIDAIYMISGHKSK